MIRHLSKPISDLALKDYGAFHCGLFLSARQESLDAARKADGARRRHHVRMARAHHRSLMRALREWKRERARQAEYTAALVGSGSFAHKLLESVQS